MTPTLVAPETSRMIASKAAVSSACFWLCSAIFSLNLRGVAIVAENDNLVVILASWGVSSPSTNHVIPKESYDDNLPQGVAMVVQIISRFLFCGE